MRKTIYEIFGSDAAEMTIRLMEEADIASCIPSKNARIALKPNLVLDDIPENGAVTHPGVIEGCVRYLHKNGFHSIEVIESSWVGADTGRAYDKSGIGDVCRAYKVPFYDLKKDETQMKETPFGPIRVSKRAAEADFFIDLPVLKGHCQTKMTCALKNLKGCIPDREKRRFHAEGLMKPIAALAAALPPDLVIVDSICGDLDFEEGGTPVRTNRMYLGFDPVNIDAYGARLMGLSPKEIGYLTQAAEWGAGELSLYDTEIIRLNEPADAGCDHRTTGRADSVAGPVKEDRACSACYAALVRALYRMGSDCPVQKDRIHIGQGWKNMRFDGIGIGECARGADCHVPGCPPSAEAILQFFRTTP